MPAIKSVETKDAASILDAIVQAAPLFQQLLPFDCMLGITDRQQFIGSFPGKTIKIATDIMYTDIPEGDAIYEAIRQEKIIKMVVPKEIMGFSFLSYAMPIRDNTGSVIGGLGLGISIDNREDLMHIAQNVAASSQETSAAVQELAASAERLSVYEDSLKRLAEEVSGQIGETKNIIEFIKQISQTSNMLGLNASIEAARAGEHGRGFSVVAKEIRKMAENSANSIKGIETILQNVRDKIEQISTKISETATIGLQQTAATEELSQAMQELAQTAERLEKAANNVVG